MSENKGKTTLMILLTALGSLAIIILFGWVAFFNPMENQSEKPVLALSSLGDPEDLTVLPEKSADELLLDGLQKGEETPGLIEDDSEIVVQVEEKTTAALIVEEEPKPIVKATPEKVVEYREVTEDVYWLQVGSFPNSVNADKLRDVLKERGIDSIMQTKNVNGTLYYRVRVGAFVNENEAESFKNKLLNLNEISEVTLYTNRITKNVPVN